MEASEHNSTQSGCPGCRERDKRIAALERENADLRSRMKQLEQRVEQLTGQLEQAQRAGKRQAAPFSKGEPKREPRKPGRQSGEAYGVKAHRPAPEPEQIDETHEAALPGECPHCGAGGEAIHETRIAEQYQVDLPRQPIHRRFRVHLGCCTRCQRAVQGQHELQTSDALGAASSQLGPNAQATVAHLNKTMGLSHGKVADLFNTLFAITLTRGGACQAMQRVARRCEGTYEQLINALNQSASVTADETGWRVGGLPGWLHAMVGRTMSVYHIDRQRGYEASIKLLKPDYAGVLVHDGWRPYDRFFDAHHQTCLAHLLRRCNELLETATGGAVNFPRQIKAMLQQALAVRDQYAAHELTGDQVALKAEALHARLLKRITRIKTHPGNEKLAAHLCRHQRQVFTFLDRIDHNIDATNWRAEQALRPAVVNRKVWGGNRTHAGARAQSILMTVLTTCRQQHRDPLDWLSHHLRGQPPPPLA